jgi:hypothetical protein
MLDRTLSKYADLPPEVTLDVETYKAHWPPQVRALWGINDIAERAAKARDLEAAGFFVDLNTMIYQEDPVLYMYYSQMFGLTWIGPAHLGGAIDNGGSGSGDVPVGYEKVSVKAEDFPPFDPPVIPVLNTNIVGKETYPGNFAPGPGWKGPDGVTPVVRDGQIVEQGGKKYVAHVKPGLMGIAGWFTEAE